MKKILILVLVGILVISGIGTACVTSEPLTSHKQMQGQKPENKLQFPYIHIYIKEIYGTFDNPQYRPLANVTIVIKESPFYRGIIWIPFWNGITDENGTASIIVYAEAGVFKTTVSKDGYHTYKCLPFHIDFMEWIDVYIYFIMADDNGPFIKSVSQQSLINQNLLCNLLLQQMVKINKKK